MDTCNCCKQPIEVGAWPWCPHGRGTPQVIDDTILGGEVLENVADQPITVYSKSERRRVLREHNVFEFVRHVGQRGSDKSPHTTRWI